MTTPIRTNKPVFFGDNGDVLKNGYIYIGQPDSDPIANPKTVTFRDSAGGEFTAAQPLRTNTQGRIEYNGLAIIALVDGNYSMLVQDRNQVTVKDGYTKLIEADDESSGDNIITYRATLSDLKAVNVTPGQYVENIGKATAEDGEGVRWLVVSNTAGTADDVDLIDFDNGTQGKRVSNQLYVIKNLSEIADAGATAQGEAQANIDVYSTGEIDGFVDSFSSPIEVWSGSQANVDFNADITGGYPGNGIYLINNSTLMFIVEGSVSRGIKDIDLNNPGGGGGRVLADIFAYSTSDLLTGKIDSLELDGTFNSTPLNITSIKKVAVF